MAANTHIHTYDNNFFFFDIDTVGGQRLHTRPPTHVRQQSVPSLGVVNSGALPPPTTTAPKGAGSGKGGGGRFARLCERFRRPFDKPKQWPPRLARVRIKFLNIADSFWCLYYFHGPCIMHRKSSYWTLVSSARVICRSSALGVVRVLVVA